MFSCHFETRILWRFEWHDTMKGGQVTPTPTSWRKAIHFIIKEADFEWRKEAFWKAQKAMDPNDFIVLLKLFSCLGLLIQPSFSNAFQRKALQKCTWYPTSHASFLTIYFACLLANWVSDVWSNWRPHFCKKKTFWKSLNLSTILTARGPFALIVWKITQSVVYFKFGFFPPVFFSF